MSQMSDYQETEVKLYTPDLEAMHRRLLAQGATITKTRLFERNIRYENAAGTLTGQGIVLRLRQDDGVRLTYKDAATARDGIVSRFEAEVTISDFDAMHTILSKLGYHPFMIYEKYRTTFMLDDLEIVLDEMPYGNFTEIEGEHRAIETLVDRLGLGGAPRFAESYVRIFDHVRSRLGLAFTDLTFDNFTGIMVTETLFERGSDGFAG